MPGPGRFTGPAYKSPFNPASWAWGVGLWAYFLNPISCPPTLGYGERGQGLYRFSNRVRLPRVRSGLVWLGLCRHQTSCGTNDFSTFALISSSSLGFFREHPLIVCIVSPNIEDFSLSASSGFFFLKTRLTLCSESLLVFL